MQCQEFFEYAERWMEGEHNAAASVHLEGCPRCRGLVTDLNAIRDTAHQFEAEVEPPARLWAAVRSQLEAEGVIRGRSWAERFAVFFPLQPRAIFAAAYVAALLVAAALVSFQSANRVEGLVALAPAAPEAALLSLRSALVGERTLAELHTHNPEVLRSYRESLQMVDNVILECEMMVNKDPQNALAREYLNGAKQQKADLLAAITERGTLGE